MLAVGDWKNQKNKTKKGSKHSNMRWYISRIWGEETPERIGSKFFLVTDIRDIIMPVKFGDDR